MVRFLENVGANPGRGAHKRAVEAGRIIYDAREAVAQLFHAPDPLRVVFGMNVTEALNLVLRGLLHAGDHVVTSSVEHNSVMRPLRALERQGVEVTVAQCSPQGTLSVADVRSSLRPNTRLVVLIHASNVIGTVLPIADVGRLCRERGILLLVDAAQTGGAYPIDVQADCIDLLAFTGHKSLGGPMGTGGLILGQGVDEKQIEPLMRGGTGSRSEYELQPDFLPDMFESGTPNGVGLAGLLAGVRDVLKKGVPSIRAHEVELTSQLLSGLLAIPGVVVYGTRDPELQTATVSFNIKGMASSEVGLRLDEEWDIACRVGLHCSPAAHKTIGTFPAGTVRFGLGASNTGDEVDTAIAAVRQLAQEVG